MTWQDPAGPAGERHDAPPPPPPSPAYQPGYPPGGYGAGPQPSVQWAPPPVQPSFGPGASLELGSVLARFVAWFVDGLILGFATVIILVPLDIVVLGSVNWAQLATTRPGDAGLALGGAWVASAVGTAITLALSLAYFVLQWTGSARATLGMRLLHLQIGSVADGRTLTRREGVTRWLAMGSWLSAATVIPVVGSLCSLLLLIWYVVLLATTMSSSLRQGVHDRAAGSLIVQPAGTSNNACVIGCLAVLALVAVGVVLSILALILLGSQVSTILSQVGTSI